MRRPKSAQPHKLPPRPHGSMDSTAAAAAAVRAFYDFLNAKDAEGLYGLLAENIEWDCNEIATSAQKVHRCILKLSESVWAPSRSGRPAGVR